MPAPLDDVLDTVLPPGAGPVDAARLGSVAARAADALDADVQRHMRATSASPGATIALLACIVGVLRAFAQNATPSYATVVRANVLRALVLSPTFAAAAFDAAHTHAAPRVAAVLTAAHAAMPSWQNYAALDEAAQRALDAALVYRCTVAHMTCSDMLPVVLACDDQHSPRRAPQPPPVAKTVAVGEAPF